MNNIFATDEEIKYAQDILLGKENHFSAEKIAVIKSNDSKDVVACPGSGKTTTLLAKLAILATRMPIEEGKGVCVRQVDVRTASSSYCLPNRKRLVAFPALH